MDGTIESNSSGCANVYPHQHVSFGPPESILKQRLHLFSHCCTAHGRVSSHRVIPGMLFPSQSCSFPWRDLNPDLTSGSLGPPNSASQTASRSVSRLCTAHGRRSLYFTMSRLQPKLPFPMGRSEPPSNTWFLGPTQVLIPNSTSIGSAIFAGLTTVRDRHQQTMLVGR